MKPFFFPLRRHVMPLAAVCALSLALGMSASAAPKKAARKAQAPFDIHLVAINDFHGYLEAQNYTYTGVDDGGPQTVRAGGIEALSGTLQSWRKDDPELLLVGGGDLVGASPPLSAMWADEPTIMAMNLLGLRATSVGNHEFDIGTVELLRKQNGGCATPVAAKACKFDGAFKGAQFSYLASNVIDDKTGKLLLPAYRIEKVRGVKIALIGAVLQGTPTVVKASGVAGVHFEDEADAINRVLPELRKQGVTAFVVLIHEGGTTQEHFDQSDCANLKGEIVGIVKRLDPAIRLIVSGHSHQGYLCKVDGRTVTQAQTAGHMLTRIALTINPKTRAVQSVQARNVVIRADGAAPATPEVSALLAQVRQRSAEVLGRPIARLAVPRVTRTQNGAGESALGDLVSDAQLAASKKLGAQIVFLNHSTLRSDLYANADGVSTFSQSATVVPFGNNMVMMTLTGAEIVALLEQQRWKINEGDDAQMLEVSDGFSYQWDARRPAGSRVVPGSLRLDGKAMQDTVDYRIAANSFIAEGGDKYTVFKAGRDRVDTDLLDVATLTDYLAERDKAGSPAGAAMPAKRIERIQ